MDVHHEHYESYKVLAQTIADATSLILGLSTIIMDDSEICIAGTGVYAQQVGLRIEQNNTAFNYCLLHCTSVLIDKAGEHPVCKECPQRSSCTEKAEICVPILVHEKMLGVVGLVAFNELEKQILIYNYDNYQLYLSKISGLLGVKLAEIEALVYNDLLSDRLHTIVNLLSESVIFYSIDGQALYKNAALEKLLGEFEIKDIEAFCAAVWQHKTMKRFLQSGEKTSELQEMTMHFDNKDLMLIASFNRLCRRNDKDDIIVSLQSAKRMERRIMQISKKHNVYLNFDDIIGDSEALKAVKTTAHQLATLKTNVLITGESGTGKEMFARAIHNASQRSEYPFVPINCGAIPGELMESELFGHEKGAFSGAFQEKIGKFEVADHGTVFLDEIGEMPLHLQVKLLRALQDGEICRVGGNKIHHINVRIISATNRDLKKQVAEGCFREDLYYRLNVIPLHLPPLRERQEDVIPLAYYFLNFFAKESGRELQGISDAAQRALVQYSWPGNIRELRNVMEFAVNLESSPMIELDTIKRHLSKDKNNTVLLPSVQNASTLNQFLEAAEKEFLTAKIQEGMHSNTRVETLCRNLGISRATLYRKLKKLNIQSDMAASLNSDTIP